MVEAIWHHFWHVTEKFALVLNVLNFSIIRVFHLDIVDVRSVDSISSLINDLSVSEMIEAVWHHLWHVAKEFVLVLDILNFCVIGVLHLKLSLLILKDFLASCIEGFSSSMNKTIRHNSVSLSIFPFFLCFLLLQECNSFVELIFVLLLSEDSFDAIIVLKLAVVKCVWSFGADLWIEWLLLSKGCNNSIWVQKLSIDKVIWSVSSNMEIWLDKKIADVRSINFFASSIESLSVSKMVKTISRKLWGLSQVLEVMAISLLTFVVNVVGISRKLGSNIVLVHHVAVIIDLLAIFVGVEAIYTSTVISVNLGVDGIEFLKSESLGSVK